MSQKFQINHENILISANSIVDKKIPASVTSTFEGNTDNYAFIQSIETLQKVSFEDNPQITIIGSYSFYQCTNLKEVDLSNCKLLTSINYLCFAYCYSMNSIIFPPNINKIGSNSFRCVHIDKLIDLTNIEVDYNTFTNTTFSFSCADPSTLQREYQNNIYSLDFSSLLFVSFSTTNLTFHPYTTTIGKCAFSSSSLEEIVFPKQISNIQIFCVHLNDYVKKIVLSENIKVIGEYFIFNNPNLEFIYIPEGITSIEKNGISDCSTLKYIHFPKSLVNVSINTFYLPSLRLVIYEKFQYELLLNAGIPERALNPFRSCSLSKSRNYYALLLVIIVI